MAKIEAKDLPKQIDEITSFLHQGGHRPHLGASLIGRECLRELWYKFNWAKDEDFDGRILRLFRRGQNEEKIFCDDLEALGVKVIATNQKTGEQIRTSTLSGHFGGSIDGTCEGKKFGFKDWILLEFKTHNEKSFKDLEKHQVQRSKPEHFAQMQVYMFLLGAPACLYIAVNKNTDHLYAEMIELEENFAKAMISKAEMVIEGIEPPAKIKEDPTWYKCKMCNFHGLCHGEEWPEINCRTCINGQPVVGKDKLKVTNQAPSWSCSKHGISLTEENQRAGCEDHRYKMGLANFDWAKFESWDVSKNVVYYKSNEGKIFANGSKGDDSYPSNELPFVKDAAVSDKFINRAREAFGASVKRIDKIKEDEKNNFERW